MTTEPEMRRGSIAHDLRQPLNVIALAVGNVRARIVPGLGEAEAGYLEGKLGRIEEQVARMTELLEDDRIAGRQT